MTSLSSSTIRILSAPWQQRRNAGGFWFILLVVALCFSAAIALFAWSLFTNAELAASLRHGAAVSGRVAVVTLLIAWWALLVANVLEQNHPSFARLVPAHPAQLRLALVAAGAAVVAVAVALLAATMRWPLLWALGSVGWAYVLAAAPRSPGLSDAVGFVQRQWQEQPLALAATAFAAAIVLLVALVQDGGRRHAANYGARRDRLLRMQGAMRGEPSLHPRQPGSLASLLHSPYHAWLRHVLATPGGSVRARTLLGLGPGVHWTTVPFAFVVTAVGSAFTVGLMALVARVFPALQGFFVPVILSSVAIGVMFGLLSPGMQMQTRLHQTRREQALLALLPGVPQRAALNRWLGWQLSAQFMAAWLGGLVLMASLSVLAPHLGRPTVDISFDTARALMVLATLPLVMFQWRRWAWMSTPTPLNAGIPALVGLVLATLAFSGQASGWFTLPEAGIAFALATLAWCTLRWWRMGSEPGAFPVGRFA